MKNWTDKSTKSLIKMYEQYDPDLTKYKDNFKNPELKWSLWGIIADVHRTTVPEVQRKIKLLRNKFAFERKRYEYDMNYFKNNPWRFFRNFMFLLEEDETEFGSSSAVSESYLSESNCSSKEFGTEDSSAVPSRHQDESQDFESSVNFDGNDQLDEEDEDITPANKKRKLNSPDASLEDALKCIKTLLDESDKRDEHSIYGEHIAHRLRTCNRNNSDIAIAQHHIENIVFNLSMGVYRQEATDALDVKADLAIPPIITRSVPEPLIIPKADPGS